MSRCSKRQGDDEGDGVEEEELRRAAAWRKHSSVCLATSLASSSAVSLLARV
jgi:hypothetical protein